MVVAYIWIHRDNFDIENAACYHTGHRIIVYLISILLCRAARAIAAVWVHDRGGCRERFISVHL
jgi:hypothetical protein